MNRLDTAISDRSHDAEAVRQVVTFALNSHHYAVDILTVREIRMLQSVSGLPGAHETIRGVINLRGSIVPVYDLSLRFGQARTNVRTNHPSVIVSVDGRLTALLVDEVLDIVTVPEREVKRLPETDTARGDAMFEGVVQQESGMLIVVDLKRVFDADKSAAAEVF